MAGDDEAVARLRRLPGRHGARHPGGAAAAALRPRASGAHWVTLTPHPCAPAPALTLRACIRRSGAALALRFEAQGDLAAVRLPAPAPPAFTDGLWRHTCFELFVAEPGAEPYVELNVAPSGAWALYAFARRRIRAGAPAAPPTPRVEIVGSAEDLIVDVRVPCAGVLAPYAAGALAVGPTAVVEDAAGACSFWALRHPPGPPDFHHPAVRSMVLAAA